MLHLAGKNQDAMQQFQIALRQDPQMKGANLFAGLSELDLGRPSAALPYLQRAEKLDPNQPAPLLALGRTYLALRDYQRANEKYAQAAALDANLAEAWYGVGVTNRSLADEMLNRAVRAGVNKTSAQQKAQDLLAKAQQALTRAVDLEPSSPRTHLILAESLADSGKFTDAVREYQTTINLAPNLDGAYLGLASLYWKQRQFEQARPLLDKILAKSPTDPEANGMMADILQHDGKDADAERHAKLALSGNPNLIETHVVLARIYVDRQQPAAAIAELQKVIAADPDGSYHFLLYRAYKMAGDQQAASAALAKFRQLRNGASAQ
jgi:tetratricopeptide (TPR) repeat protein